MLEISMTVLVVVCLGAIVGLGFIAYYDYKHGATQSYIYRDGTIHEWDRFGNQMIVRVVDGIEVVEVNVVDPERGLGPIYSRDMPGDSLE